jgi:hypothetical protein
VDIDKSGRQSPNLRDPYDDSIEMKQFVPMSARSSKKYNAAGIRKAERTRHSYSTCAFFRRTNNIRAFISAETERLLNQDHRALLGAASRLEVEILANGANCSIRRRMFKMGLL